MPRVTGFPRVGFPPRGHISWFVSSVGLRAWQVGVCPAGPTLARMISPKGGARAHSPHSRPAAGSILPRAPPATPIPQDPGGLRSTVEDWNRQLMSELRIGPHIGRGPRLRAKAPATRSASSSRNKGSALREPLQPRQVLGEQLLGRTEVAEADRSRSEVAGSPTPCTPSRSPLTGRRRRQQRAAMGSSFTGGLAIVLSPTTTRASGPVCTRVHSASAPDSASRCCIRSRLRPRRRPEELRRIDRRFRHRGRRDRNVVPHPRAAETRWGFGQVPVGVGARAAAPVDTSSPDHGHASGEARTRQELAATLAR